MPDEPIYDFQALKDALEENGIPVGNAEGYSPVTPGDVIFHGTDGNVFFENESGEDGIYIKDGRGVTHQVFMYKRDYHLSRYGNPRYHVCKCETIQDFIDRGAFEHYKYANTDVVPVQDMDDFYEEKQVSDLQLCAYCAKMLDHRYTRSMMLEDFVEILREAGDATDQQEDVDVDMFGYVKNWQQISQAYRVVKNYTCEECGFSADTPMKRRFIQVHHIDGNKLNNRQENFRCVCTRCHANQDDTHRRNFAQGDHTLQLQSFLKNHSSSIKTFTEYKRGRNHSYYSITIDGKKFLNKISFGEGDNKEDVYFLVLREIVGQFHIDINKVMFCEDADGNVIAWEEYIRRE